MNFEFVRGSRYQDSQGVFIIDKDDELTIHIQYISGESRGKSQWVRKHSQDKLCLQYLKSLFSKELHELDDLIEELYVYFDEGNMEQVGQVKAKIISIQLKIQNYMRPRLSNQVIASSVSTQIQIDLNTRRIKRLQGDYQKLLLEYKRFIPSLNWEKLGQIRRDLTHEDFALLSQNSDIDSDINKLIFELVHNEFKAIKEMLQINFTDRDSLTKSISRIRDYKLNLYILLNLDSSIDVVESAKASILLEINGTIDKLIIPILLETIKRNYRLYYIALVKKQIEEINQLGNNIISLRIRYHELFTSNAAYDSQQLAEKFQNQLENRAFEYEHRRLKRLIPDLMADIVYFSRALKNTVKQEIGMTQVLLLKNQLVEKRVEFCIALFPRTIEEIDALRKNYQIQVQNEFSVSESEAPRMCWVCLSHLSHEINAECPKCRWWVCLCGACKCPDYWNGKKRKGVECGEQGIRFGNVGYKMLLMLYENRVIIHQLIRSKYNDSNYLYHIRSNTVVDKL